MKFTISTCIRSLTILVAGTLAFTLAAQGQTFSVLHTFTGKEDGAIPQAGLVGDGAGNLYGTTYYGGDPACPVGCGTVFKVSRTGKHKVLYSFRDGTDGGFPAAALVRDPAGNLYGTTVYGGDPACNTGLGCGTVFMVDTNGTETVLHSFVWPTDGEFPVAGLVWDSAGNLYGTNSYFGGLSCCGTVFKVDTNGTATVLHSFNGGTDGGIPLAGLVRDRAGNLYGTTYLDGDLTCYCGTVFKVDTNGTETVLYRFSGGVDGGYPRGGLVLDSAGNLYGTTVGGGDLTCNAPKKGCGTVFKLDAAGHETVLYTFTGEADGRWPYAGLVRDPAGNLYGTTSEGGDNLTCSAPYGCGTVFKVDTNGIKTVLHRFSGGADGNAPVSALIQDAAGNLYGTTTEGGDLGCYAPKGCGVVFKIAP